MEEAITVSGDFDARRSPLSRRYIYLISNKKHPSPLMSNILLMNLDVIVMPCMRLDKIYWASTTLPVLELPNAILISNEKSMQLSVSRIKDIVLIDVTANAFLSTW